MRAELTTGRFAAGRLAAVLAAMLVAGACGSDGDLGDGVSITVERSTDASGDESEAGGSAPDGEPDTPDDEDGGLGSGTDDPDDLGGGEGDGGGGSDGGTADLPGEAFDIGPPAGETLAVVGVRYDDVLNLRELPDATASIVDTVEPLSDRPVIVSSGEGRLLSRSAWWKVTVDGDEAWANVMFLGLLGGSDDVFAELRSDLASTTGDDPQDIIDAIAETRTGGPEPLVELASPIDGLDATSAQVTVDIIGLGDDAIKGERYVLTFDVIYDDPAAADRQVEGYELVAARRTVICGRGLSGDNCL